MKANKLTAMELLSDPGDKVRTAWKVPRALFGEIILCTKIVVFDFKNWMHEEF